MAMLPSPLIGACLLPNVGGWISSYMFRDSIKGWYETLKRPEWRPPNIAFPVAWTSLYTGMGCASYLVWRDTGGFNAPAAALPLGLYASQLALNWAWSPIFFGAHSLKWGLVDISLLWVNAAACGIAFYRVNPVAGFLFVPYMAWLSLAFALNYVIYRDNRDSHDRAD